MMPHRPRSRPARSSGAASMGAALLLLAALAALALLVFRGAAELNRLESRNDAERVLTSILGGLRDHESFGEVIEATPELRARVVGIGIYSGPGLLYSWGSLPPETAPAGGSGRTVERAYAELDRRGLLVLSLRTSKLWPQPPPRPQAASRPEPPPEARDGRWAFFEILRKGEFVQLALSQPRFFARKRLVVALFPLTLAVLAALVFAGRRLLLRNAEYRERIEAQRNLVVLGAAASTLAHEIKNPLLAIRLQTNLLARALPGSRAPELAVIESEVDRLSALSGRIGDFLRDPRGRPRRFDLAQLAGEVGRLLLGREVLAAPSGRPEGLEVEADPERIRSILENLIRNALESGGPPGAVRVELDQRGGEMVLDVLDRGAGIEEGTAERAFDPFFTTKSRGSGIGLPIARRFARAAGGEVELAARDGGGTRARLRLPVAGRGQAPSLPAGTEDASLDPFLGGPA